MAAHGAGCARKGGEGRGVEMVGEVKGERAVVAVLLLDVVCCYLRLRRSGAGTTPGALECRRLRLPAPRTKRDA